MEIVIILVSAVAIWAFVYIVVYNIASEREWRRARMIEEPQIQTYLFISMDELTEMRDRALRNGHHEDARFYQAVINRKKTQDV